MTLAGPEAYSRRLFSLCGAVTLCAALGGCASPNETLEDRATLPDWNSGLRAPDLSSESWGVDPRARQIERNLGVQ